MPGKAADHVVLDMATGEYVFECLHCGQTYKPTLPIPLDLMVALGSAWTKLHQRCPAPKPFER